MAVTAVSVKLWMAASLSETSGTELASAVRYSSEESVYDPYETTCWQTLRGCRTSFGAFLW